MNGKPFMPLTSAKKMKMSKKIFLELSAQGFMQHFSVKSMNLFMSDLLLFSIQKISALKE